MKSDSELKYYAIAVLPNSEADYFLSNFVALNISLPTILGKEGCKIRNCQMVKGFVKAATSTSKSNHQGKAAKKSRQGKSPSGSSDNQNVQLSLNIEL